MAVKGQWTGGGGAVEERWDRRRVGTVIGEDEGNMVVLEGKR